MENFLELIQNSTPWQGIYFSLAFTFIFLDIVLVCLIVWIVRKSMDLRPHFDFMAIEENVSHGPLVHHDAKVAAQWKELRKNIGTTPAHSPVRTVLNADKFVDEILRRDLKLRGEHIADRLEQLNASVVSERVIENLLRAHRIANELKSAPDFDLSQVDMNETLDLYESFLFEIGTLA